MLRQVLFILIYCGLIPTVFMSPFAGVLIYKWLELLPPGAVYYVSLLPENLSLVIGALTVSIWLIKEPKQWPRPFYLIVLLAAFFIWINVTSLFALAPEAAVVKWERTVKVVGFAILTAQMLSTRPRIEAYVWVQVICIAFSAVPGAIKTIVGGGGAFTVIGATGSFLEDRVAFAVILPVVVPLALFLANHAQLLSASRWQRLALQGVAACCLISLVGTFARTALFSGGVGLIMLVAKVRTKLRAVVVSALLVVAVLALAPQTWFQRMDTTVDYQQDTSAVRRVETWAWAWNMALAHPITGGGFRVFVLDAPPTEEYVEAHNILFEVVAEHGFVGLALFCSLLIAAYRSCAVVRAQLRHAADSRWAYDLAGMLQVALVAYVAGGMFISVATSPFLYDLLAMAVGLRGLVERESRAPTRNKASYIRHDEVPKAAQ
jgi:putative inorganic carbon (HCO3(-)) transporter